MATLAAQICDVWGEPIAGAVIGHTMEGGGLSVTVPHCDARTASLTVSVHDPIARHARPLSRILSVTYGATLIFKGPILQPTIDFAAETVTINAHDPSIKLKHHYHRFGDRAVDEGYPVDGRGFRRLIESSVPTQAELARDVPPNGILWGEDTTDHTGPKPDDLTDPEEGDGIWRKVERGANVWDTIQNLTQVGLEFRLEPVDPHHPRGHDPVPTGFYCELDTLDLPGEIPDTPLVVFEHGAGLDNAENITYEPDGDVVRNWFRQVNPSGERDRQDQSSGVTAQKKDSQENFGIMQGWESSGQRDSLDVLREKAKSWVTAYGRPPDYFTVTPRADDAPNIPQYPHDYQVGDFIRVRAHKGVREIDEIGRVMTATISAIDQAGNAKVTLECVPFLPDEPIDS